MPPICRHIIVVCCIPHEGGSNAHLSPGHFIFALEFIIHILVVDLNLFIIVIHVILLRIVPWAPSLLHSSSWGVRRCQSYRDAFGRMVYYQWVVVHSRSWMRCERIERRSQISNLSDRISCCRRQAFREMNRNLWGFRLHLNEMWSIFLGLLRSYQTVRILRSFVLSSPLLNSNFFNFCNPLLLF